MGDAFGGSTCRGNVAYRRPAVSNVDRLRIPGHVNNDSGASALGNSDPPPLSKTSPGSFNPNAG